MIDTQAKLTLVSVAIFSMSACCSNPLGESDSVIKPSSVGESKSVNDLEPSCDTEHLKRTLAKLKPTQTSLVSRRAAAAKGIQTACGKSIPSWLDDWLDTEVNSAKQVATVRIAFDDGPSPSFETRQRTIAKVCDLPYKKVASRYEKLSRMPPPEREAAIYETCRPLLSQLMPLEAFVAANGPDTAWVLFGWLLMRGVAVDLARPLALELVWREQLAIRPAIELPVGEPTKRLRKSITVAVSSESIAVDASPAVFLDKGRWSAGGRQTVPELQQDLEKARERHSKRPVLLAIDRSVPKRTVQAVKATLGKMKVDCEMAVINSKFLDTNSQARQDVMGPVGVAPCDP